MAKQIDTRELELEHQYKLYLQRLGLVLEKMHPQQAIETKRAFYGGCTQMLVLFRDVFGRMDDEDRAIGHMEDLFIQAEQFWEEQE